MEGAYVDSSIRRRASCPDPDHAIPFGRRQLTTSTGKRYLPQCMPSGYSSRLRFRCFPKFDADLRQNLTGELGSSLTSSTFSAVKEEFGGTGERVQRYVADITKGWLIIFVGGLCTAVLIAMVTTFQTTDIDHSSAHLSDLALNPALLCRADGMGDHLRRQRCVHRMHRLCLRPIWKIRRNGLRWRRKNFLLSGTTPPTPFAFPSLSRAPFLKTRTRRMTRGRFGSMSPSSLPC